MAGDLAALLTANGITDRLRNQNLQVQQMTAKQNNANLEDLLKGSEITRAHPTLTEQAGELSNIRGNSPQNLDDLLRLHSQDPDSLLGAKTNETNSHAKYFDAETEDKKAKQAKADQKLVELKGHATTLNDQLGKIKDDLDKIPEGYIFGKLAKAAGSTGNVPWSGAQQDLLSRLDPIVDTYTKMTAGRASPTIIASMKKNIIDSIGNTGTVRKSAIDALTDFLDTEYHQTALAHGADADSLLPLTSLKNDPGPVVTHQGRGNDGHLYNLDANQKILGRAD